MDLLCTSRTIGETNRNRQLAGAGVLLLGAVPVALATLAGWPAYGVLVLLGAAATLAWLVDGSSRRYMGPGLTALAVGGGIALHTALDMSAMKGEHGVVYPLIGAAILIGSLFHPLALRGAGAFLVIVGAVALISWPWNVGWSLAAILVVWSIANCALVGRRDAGAGARLVDRDAEEPGVRRQTVEAGRR